MQGTWKEMQTVNLGIKEVGYGLGVSLVDADVFVDCEGIQFEEVQRYADHYFECGLVITFKKNDVFKEILLACQVQENEDRENGKSRVIVSDKYSSILSATSIHKIELIFSKSLNVYDQMIKNKNVETQKIYVKLYDIQPKNRISFFINYFDEHQATFLDFLENSIKISYSLIKNGQILGISLFDSLIFLEFSFPVSDVFVNKKKWIKLSTDIQILSFTFFEFLNIEKDPFSQSLLYLTNNLDLESLSIQKLLYSESSFELHSYRNKLDLKYFLSKLSCHLSFFEFDPINISPILRNLLNFNQYNKVNESTTSKTICIILTQKPTQVTLNKLKDVYLSFKKVQIKILVFYHDPSQISSSTWDNHKFSVKLNELQMYLMINQASRSFLDSSDLANQLSPFLKSKHEWSYIQKFLKNLLFRLQKTN